MLTVVEAWDFTKVPFIIDENSAAKSSAAAVSTQLDHLVTQLDTWDNTAQAVMKKSQFMSEPQLTFMTRIADAIPTADVLQTTAYKLMLALDNGAWVWKPRLPKSRHLPPYAIEDATCPKEYYSSGPTIDRHYLATLLISREL